MKRSGKTVSCSNSPFKKFKIKNHGETRSFTEGKGMIYREIRGLSWKNNGI
jgi:hypothetical protein